MCFVAPFSFACFLFCDLITFPFPFLLSLNVFACLVFSTFLLRCLFLLALLLSLLLPLPPPLLFFPVSFHPPLAHPPPPILMLSPCGAANLGLPCAEQLFGDNCAEQSFMVPVR